MVGFAPKFEKDFVFLNFLSSNEIVRDAWYVDSGKSQNITSTLMLFSSLKNKE
jgi:hypothetical protein